MGMRAFRPADDAGTHAAVSESFHGGRLATLLSGVALLLSGLSYYESALKQAALEVFVPPVIQYGRDGDAEVFAVPITIANNGSNTGTVLAMELLAQNPAATGEQARSKTFYSAFTGEHARAGAEGVNRSFAPISVPGRGTYTETIRFYPQGDYFPKLIDDKGTFAFTLRLLVASPQDPVWYERLLIPAPPKPLSFTRELPFISHQHLELRRGTLSMNAPDWRPATTGSGPKALSAPPEPDPAPPAPTP
jgi:hypothetical protein